VAASLAGCGPPEKTVVIHPEYGDAARHLFRVDFTQQVTVPDNFVLRPDEFTAATPDHPRGHVYVGSREGTLLALDLETGAVAWEEQLGGAVNGRATVTQLPGEDGRGGQAVLLVGTDNGELIAIDLDTRTIRWRYQTDGTLRTASIVWQGVVYFVNSRDQVFALDVRTGAWRWQYEQELQTDFTVAGRAGLTFVPGREGDAREVGTLFTGFSNGKVVALGASSGEALWLASVAPPEGGNFIDCDSTPLVDLEAGQVVVSGQSTGVHALAISDGSVRWRFDARATGTVVAGPGGDLVAASSLEGVFALDDAGQMLWRTQVDPGVVSTPVVIDDTAYVTHSASGLLAFDIATGEYLAGIDPGSGMSSVPVYDPIMGRLYMTTNRGLLLALHVEPAHAEAEP
jgi:outer membrane protein assembly factor BamB